MLLAVVGPTASGKSGFALDLADALGGPDAAEIVSADAFQFYRGMDIGTAKVTGADQRGYVHHHLDVLDISEDASVATYQDEARSSVANILGRNKIPVVAGGSGLYVRALLDHIEFPGTDPAVRKELERELEELGPGALHRRLEHLDPLTASKIDPRNGRRTVRALEVIEITGRKFSASLPPYQYFQPATQIGLRLPMDLLDDRIERRTHQMFDAGLVEEVRLLAEKGLAETKTASRATGYAQVLEMLAGKITESEAKDAIALATRQLARRQIKWFRRDPRITWLDPSEKGALEVVLARFRDAQDAEALL